MGSQLLTELSLSLGEILLHSYTIKGVLRVKIAKRP